MKMYSRLFNYADAPVRVHLSIILVFVYFYLKHADVSAIYYAFSYLVLILVHELGHAYYAHKCQYRILSVDIFPIHGVCKFEHDSNSDPRIIVYAGGLIAQFILFVIWAALLGALRLSDLGQLALYLKPITYSFIWLNLFMAVLNMLPIPGLDGFEILTRAMTYSARKNKKVSSVDVSDMSASEIVDRAIQKAKRNST